MKAMMCRIGQLVQTADALVDEYKEVINANYEHPTKEQVCSIPAPVLKRHYDLSIKVKEKMAPLIARTNEEEECLKLIDKWYKGWTSEITSFETLIDGLKKDRENQVSGQFKRLYSARESLHTVENAISLFAPISALSRSCIPKVEK